MALFFSILNCKLFNFSCSHSRKSFCFYFIYDFIISSFLYFSILISLIVIILIIKKSSLFSFLLFRNININISCFFLSGIFIFWSINFAFIYSFNFNIIIFYKIWNSNLYFLFCFNFSRYIIFLFTFVIFWIFFII